jgi:hypothetical protein
MPFNIYIEGELPDQRNATMLFLHALIGTE